MQPDWQAFLTAQGAIIEDGVVQRFGNSIKPADTALCDLGQFCTLRASGSDAKSFLQNLLSNDINEVNQGQAQTSSFNSAKGRMLATFLIWQEGDDYLLQLPRKLAEAMRKKLSMYVLRAKVKITDTEIISLGLSGDGAQDVLGQLCGELPKSALGVVRIDETCCAIRLSDTRFLLNSTQPKTLWKMLVSRTQPVGSDHWDLLNIRAGIPIILPETQEQFVPQMANLDLTGGINFRKGCYPGQEIVARMHYLGKLKRRMYLAHLKTDIAPQPGDELYSQDMEGQACGMIANAAAAPEGGYDVLAVVQISSRDAHTVYLGSLQGAPLSFGELPYTLPQQAA